jgi:hypothetical protein
MFCLGYLRLGMMLSVVGGVAPAFAYDQRVNPDAAQRHEISFDFSQSIGRALSDAVKSELRPGEPRLPREYASAMTWYSVAMASGYSQPPVVASPWGYDEQLPEPLNWTWVADDGTLVTRMGKGIFRISFADNQHNWFWDVDCQMTEWPGGDTEAPMACSDGTERRLAVPGGGTITVDDVPFTRVFDSEQTNLPPEVPVEELLKRLEASGVVASAPQTGSIPGGAPQAEAAPAKRGAGGQVAADGSSQADAAGSDASGSDQIQGTPAKVPLPKPRPENPFY